ADIPVGARILAVADAWVAMTSDRPYRKAKDIRKALDEMRENEGTQFDPDVVQALVRLLESDSDRVPQRDH
ncbi:MAG: metal-dependent phosphohydrolase, partial [Coriobacteriia bacterium]|nr:metal-dependent phosphohydrolase [Coriobacteriia bacterium]